MALTKEQLKELNVPEESIQIILEDQQATANEFNETLIRLGQPVGMTEDEAKKHKIMEIKDSEMRQKAIKENIHLFQ